MKTSRPIQAKNTYRILKSILPESFKMVSDKKSNGYKYINLLYGVEIDEIRDRLRDVYDNTSLARMAFNDNVAYQIIISGIPQDGILNSTNSGIPIYIVDEDHFYNGDPTRIYQNGSMLISGIPSGIGIEYFRSSEYCSGYLIINSDMNQGYSYEHGVYPSYLVFLDSHGQITGYSGVYTGIKEQSYDSVGVDELLAPPNSGSLMQQYPLYRNIVDDYGNPRIIDHYEPYTGWLYNSNNEVIADTTSYNGDFYYDEDGSRVFYRSAYNNPYGFNNYTTVYIPLKHVPISGSLRLFDIDVLDSSGNATEIPMSGLALYTKQADDMFDSSGTEFNPIYMGYDQYVPNDIQFGSIANTLASYYVTTSWDYVRTGSGKNENTQLWVESSSGNLINMIKITNPMGRYIVEYKYLDFNKVKYISSQDTLQTVRISTDNPLYTLENLDNNITQVEYKFTNDPRWNVPVSGLYPYMILTLDGWVNRPGSILSSVDMSVPVQTGSGTLNSYNLLQPEYSYIGYSDKFIPSYTPQRDYVFKTYFDMPVTSGNICTELNIINSGIPMVFTTSGNNFLYQLPYEGYYCKKILYQNGNCNYLISASVLKQNTFFKMKFKLGFPKDLTLLEVSDYTNDRYFRLDISSNGIINLVTNSKEDNIMNGTTFITKDPIAFESINELIIHYSIDPDYSDTLLFNFYLKSGGSYFKRLDYYKEFKSTYTLSGDYISLAKNCSPELYNFEIYYEDIPWEQ